MDLTNEQRAGFAQAAIDAHVSAKEGNEADVSITDLLCDLMHWFDVNEGEVVCSFEDALNMARYHYRQEHKEQSERKAE